MFHFSHCLIAKFVFLLCDYDFCVICTFIHSFIQSFTWPNCRFLPVSPMKKLRSALASRSSIQSLSPSPKPRKTAPRTNGGAATAAQPVPRRLAMRDTNIDPNARPNGQGWTDGHPTRPLALRDTNVNVQVHDNNVNKVKEVPRCTLIARPLTREQVEEVWKSATLNRWVISLTSDDYLIGTFFCKV